MYTKKILVSESNRSIELRAEERDDDDARFTNK